MSIEAERAAWAEYWTGAGAARPACLPNQSGGIDRAQREIWTAFARLLPRGASVLDIGTGDGTVLAAMVARRDLKLTGVDAAPVLPRAPKNMRLIPGVAAERLPFPDARFDAVVSQFGLEYAEFGPATREVGRVLRPGGVVRLIVHHRDGPVLPHNLARREALAWVLEQSGLIGRARAFAAARQVASLSIPAAFAEAPREAQARFPAATAGAELAEAVRRTLEMSRGRPAAEATAVLATLEARARAEIVRVDSLARAACDAPGIATLRDLLGEAGLAMAAPEPRFAEGVAAPFAWLLDGRRPAA